MLLFLLLHYSLLFNEHILSLNIVNSLIVVGLWCLLLQSVKPENDHDATKYNERQKKRIKNDGS